MTLFAAHGVGGTCHSTVTSSGVSVSRETLADAMLRCAMVRLVDLTMAPPPCSATLNARPVTSPLARFEARREPLVTSLVHSAVSLSPFDRFVLRQLDGTRDQTDVVDEVLDACRRGELDLGAPERDAVQQAVARFVMECQMISSDLWQTIA